MQAPTLRDVYEAKKTIAPYLTRTPLQYSAGLSQAMDAEIYLKHDDHLPLGAFKARGGINLLAHLSQEERDRGVITASTGNHGQSIANACRFLFPVLAHLFFAHFSLLKDRWAIQKALTPELNTQNRKNGICCIKFPLAVLCDKILYGFGFEESP